MGLGLGFSLSRPRGRPLGVGATPGTITDLQVGFTDPANPGPTDPLLSEPTLITDPLVFRWTPVSNEADAEVQFRTSPDGEWGSWVNVDVGANVSTLLESPQVYDTRIRAISDIGKRGLESDPEEFQTFTSSYTLIDSKSVTTLGTDTAPADLNLDAMGAAANEAVTRSVGDIVRIYGISGHGSGGTKEVTRGAATGWTELGFAAGASGAAQVGVRILEKVWQDGDSATVDVFNNASATTNAARVAYIVIVRRAKGDHEVIACTALSESTNPALQTIPTAGGGHGLFVWALHGANDVAPDPVFAGTGITPNIDILVQSSTTFTLGLRLVGHIFPFGTAPVDFTTNPVDAGNNAHAWGYDKVSTPA